MDLLADLTPAQREAVIHVDGPLAGPRRRGVGQDPGHHPTGRLHARQGDRRGEHPRPDLHQQGRRRDEERIEALAPRSGVWVGTFHGLCARLLRSYAPLVGIDRGFTIFDQSDRLRAVKDAMERLELEDASVTPERVDAAISRAKNDLVTPEMMSKRAGDHVQAVTAKVYARYQERSESRVGRRLRRPARPPRHDPQEAPRRPLRPRRPVPLRPRRRVSGHEPRPVRHHPGPASTGPTSA